METLLCKHTCFASFWPIVQMDPVNALFWFLFSLVSSSTVCLDTERKPYAHTPSLLLRFG